MQASASAPTYVTLSNIELATRAQAAI